MVFKAGQSGNPSGRPKGAKDRRSNLRGMLEANQEILAQRALEMALAGNEHMLKMLLDRLLPPKPREDAVNINLVSDNLVDKSRVIMRELSTGAITITEATKLMNTVALESKIYEMEQMKRDVKALQKIVFNK